MPHTACFAENRVKNHRWKQQCYILCLELVCTIFCFCLQILPEWIDEDCPFLSLLPPIYKAHVQASQLFQGCNILLVTFGVKNIVSFFIKKLLHFALKSCYILRQKLSHFWLMLHFVSKVVTIRVNVTFCGVTPLLNSSPQKLSSQIYKDFYGVRQSITSENASRTDAPQRYL